MKMFELGSKNFLQPVGAVSIQLHAAHLCFKQAQPKMCHSPKVDDGVDIFFKFS